MADKAKHRINKGAILNIENLKVALKNVLPILDSNIKQAYQEYMDGKIAAGAYSYVHDRHFLAHSVINRQDLEPEIAYNACALLAIDIRSGLTDDPENVQWQEAEKAWWDCYRAAGFTEVNKIFQCPQKQKEHL